VPTRAILGATLMITQSFLWQYPVQGRLDNSDRASQLSGSWMWTVAMAATLGG
jgi:hypothetical protein